MFELHHCGCQAAFLLQVLAMFIPIGDNIERRTFPVIPILLILANVLVFVVEMRVFVNGSTTDELALLGFFKTWGLVPSSLAKGQVSGLITYMFLHGGIMHIVGNMVVLWAFAGSLEVGLGRAALLGFYFLFGVAGGLAHAIMNWSSDLPVVGASGAVAGLIGAYTVLYGPHSRIRTLILLSVHPITVEIPATVYGMGWVLLELWSASCDPEGMSSVAWLAHVGGFVAGAGITFLCRNHTPCRIVEERDGTLTFQETTRKERVSEVDASLTAGDVPLPPLCPYCGSELTKQNRIAANLARCPNPSCERMIYADAVQPAAPVSSR
jgi:membrane associated rhomboid family serine protease